MLICGKWTIMYLLFNDMCLYYRNYLCFCYIFLQWCFMSHVIHLCSSLVGITITWIPLIRVTTLLLWTQSGSPISCTGWLLAFSILYREWFRQSCLAAKESRDTPDDPMCKQLLAVLNEPESIQIIASRFCNTT